MFVSVIVSDQSETVLKGSLWTQPLGVKGLLREAGVAFGKQEGLELVPTEDVPNRFDPRTLVLGEGPQEVVYDVVDRGDDGWVGQVVVNVHDSLPVYMLPACKSEVTCD